MISGAVMLHLKLFFRIPMNSDIMKNVDVIHNAIANNSSLSFQYCRWNTKKELEVKHDGTRYHVSPFS